VPVALVILVRNGSLLPGLDLLPRRALRRLSRGVMRWKGFRIRPIRPVRPTTVVLNDLVRDFGHEQILSCACLYNIISPARLCTV
jgi:hypothetical protein